MCLCEHRAAGHLRYFLHCTSGTVQNFRVASIAVASDDVTLQTCFLELPKTRPRVTAFTRGLPSQPFHHAKLVPSPGSLLHGGQSIGWIHTTRRKRYSRISSRKGFPCAGATVPSRASHTPLMLSMTGPCQRSWMRKLRLVPSQRQMHGHESLVVHPSGPTSKSLTASHHESGDT
jgi:hypothetical protein